MVAEMGRVSERTMFKRSSRFVRARTREHHSIAGEESLECSSSDEDEVSLSQQESCADFPEIVAVISGSF